VRYWRVYWCLVVQPVSALIGVLVVRLVVQNQGFPDVLMVRFVMQLVVHTAQPRSSLVGAFSGA
jgi:hypothetical protein